MTNMDDYVERIRSIRSLDLNQISNTTGSKLTVPVSIGVKDEDEI